MDGYERKDLGRPDEIRHIGRLRGVAGPELVGIGERHQQQVARADVATVAAGRLERASAVRDQMEDADVMQVRQRRALFESLRALDAKGRGERAAKEHRSRQPHGTQHFRKQIGSSRPVRRIGK